MRRAKEQQRRRGAKPLCGFFDGAIAAADLGEKHQRRDGKTKHDIACHHRPKAGVERPGIVPQGQPRKQLGDAGALRKEDKQRKQLWTSL